MKILPCVHSEDLAALVIATRRASRVSTHTGAALRALGQLRGVPVVGGLACAQAHLRSFAFRNSHKIRISSLFFGLQSIQSVPRRIAGRLGGIGGRL